MQGTNSDLLKGLDLAARELALADEGQPGRIAEMTAQARAHGVYPASIGPVYRALAAGRVAPLTVPAINLRGMTYDLARAVWQVVREMDAGPVIFELAPSESRAGRQTFGEYATLVLAAAVREGYRGPVFLQVDHFQVDRLDPQADAAFQNWCAQAAAAGMLQVDFDASGLTAHNDAVAPQAACAWATAAAVRYHDRLAPEADVVFGAEVGEIGGANTTVDDLREFMVAYAAAPGPAPELDKISVNTGTTHGGLVDATGQPGAMPLDFARLAELSSVARQEFGLPGVVQHAASTLSLAQLAQLPALGVCEVHLATGIQNCVFDHPQFDPDLRARMAAELLDTHTEAEGHDRREGAELTPAQRFYAGRWTSWGQFKHELWNLPEQSRAAIRVSLVEWCALVFGALRVTGSRPLLAELYGTEGKSA